METEEVPSAENCLICRGTLASPANLCVSAHEQYCSPCWVEYIESVVHSSFMGACPCVYCPSEVHHKNKRKCIVPFSTWSALCSQETSKKFCSLAGSLLAFLCGGCHALKSLDVGFDATGSSSAKLCHSLDASAEEAASKTQTLDRTLQSLQVGELPVDEAYEKLLRDVFPEMSVQNDHDAWEIFVLVLKTIPDPERRANLHLRYLRDRPRIRTLCCNREHCFHCKTKDFHEGKSCLEHTNTLDHSIVTCPQCNIALAKGDGCNTITCVCGKQFSWTTEKENTDRCRAFFEANPTETNAACARVLCESRDSSEVVRARAWQGRNRPLVASCLKTWFHEHYPQCTTQCAIVLPAESFPDGVREAMDVWIQAHPKEVEQRRKQNDIALRSIFLTIVPCESERPQAAHRIVSYARQRLGTKAVDQKLVESATRWIESNKETYQRGVEAMEERLAKQFLFSYGSRPVSTVRPSQSSFPCAVEWCKSTSNHDLTFTSNHTSVERVGSVSCYPAAFAALVAERCMMRVVVDSAPRSSNWLTFGVARRGMASSSSDGVGRTSNSWGISDDRSSAASRAIVASCGTEVDSFRKLVVGDVLTALVDVTEGWAEVSVNDTEYSHRFSIPGGTVDEYVFAMTFANDHRVTILSEPALISKEEPASATAKLSTDDSQNKIHCAPYTVTLNPEQTAGFNQLRKRVKAVLDSDDSSLSSGSGDSGKYQKTNHSELFADSSLWVKRWDGSNEVAQTQFDQLRPTIETLIGIRKGCDSDTSQSPPLANLSWNTIVEAVSWYDHNRERLRTEQRADMACTFSVTHGDDAPFLAAMTLHEFHQRRLSRSEAEAPLAYMQLFQDEMNEWYDQDSHSREPMIENMAKGCRCLPRHIRSCPVAKTNKHN